LFEGATAAGADPGAAANWITQDVAALRNAADGEGALTSRHIVDVVRLIADGEVSNAGAKQALEASFATGEAVADAVARLGLTQVSDEAELGGLADAVIAEHPDVAQKFRDGKEGVIGFLVGQLMQKAAGAANPKLAQELLRERLQG
jgi:aspartyl-tRNA(Asn)/glutamyl-tRNA(Gln) amidotransferase subunit B